MNLKNRETINLAPSSSAPPTLSSSEHLEETDSLFGESSIGTTQHLQYHHQPQQQHKILPSLKPSSNSSLSGSKVGDFGSHRPIAQSNATVLPSTALKITQIGPIGGSNVIVSRMDATTNTNVLGLRPTSSASPVPIAGPLAPSSASANNYYFNLNNNSNNSNNIPRSINPRTQGSAPSSIANSATNNTSTISNNYYHNANSTNVTKFTNMTVANAGSKNPLKPTHYTVPNNNASNSAIMSGHPNSNLTAPNTTGIAPKTTLKASDLIHILPNLFNTLKRRNSNSSAGGNRGSSSSNGTYPNNQQQQQHQHQQPYYNPNTSATNTLAAAVAAASSSGKPMTSSSAAAFVAEQLLNVAASVPMSDDSSSSPPPSLNYSKRPRLNSISDGGLQCGVCGKVYKHRNCLSKHMWEHHDSWEHTKKVCQTKHQQVQLLEAAQVLSEILSGISPAPTNDTSSDSDSDPASDEDDGEIVNELREMDLLNASHLQDDNEHENVSIGDQEFV